MASLVLTVVASWGIYALLGMGIVLVYRTSRVLNIAAGELAIFIGYVVAVAIQHGLPFPVAVPLGMGTAMMLGFAIFWFTIRRVMGEPTHVGLMLTVGIATILNGLMIVLFGGGMTAVPTGLPGFTTLGSIRLPTSDVVAAIGAWLSIAVIAIIYQVTNLGLQMRAVAERVMLSAQRGLNVDRTVALSWVIGVLAAGTCRNTARGAVIRRAIGDRSRHKRADCLPHRRHGQLERRHRSSVHRRPDRKHHNVLHRSPL